MPAQDTPRLSAQIFEPINKIAVLFADLGERIGAVVNDLV
jgi:hypothetical protein